MLPSCTEFPHRTSFLKDRNFYCVCVCVCLKPKSMLTGTFDFHFSRIGGVRWSPPASFTELFFCVLPGFPAARGRGGGGRVSVDSSGGGGGGRRQSRRRRPLEQSQATPRSRSYRVFLYRVSRASRPAASVYRVVCVYVRVSVLVCVSVCLCVCAVGVGVCVCLDLRSSRTLEQDHCVELRRILLLCFFISVDPVVFFSCWRWLGNDLTRPQLGRFFFRYRVVPSLSFFCRITAKVPLTGERKKKTRKKTNKRTRGGTFAKLQPNHRPATMNGRNK